MSLREVLEPAIHYAAHGHPLLPRVSATIADLAVFFQDEWPTSVPVWLPSGDAPEAGSLFCNPDLAATWQRLLREAESAAGREAQIEKAREAFYRGFIAESIGDWLADACVMDAAGQRRKGVLSADDMANWQASVEPAWSTDYHDWTVWKTGPWGQGPVLPQALNILRGSGIENITADSADFVHTVTEAMKLAFADREAYYGDPNDSDIPMQQLLDIDYANRRRELIGPDASTQQRPGAIAGFERLASAARDHQAGAGAGEPTMAHLTEKRGDTVHLDVIDRWGNMVTATPSGGWLQSSPVVPGLGMPLNSRAQMFWLDEGLPTSLAPGRRPRTTLSPSMASVDGRPTLAFGTPGGDQQDQWQLIYFLRLVHQKMNLQQGIDAPLFHTAHFQSSFYPRAVNPGHLMIEPSIGDVAIANLRQRGHRVDVAENWSVGRLTAAMRDRHGILHAAATPRLMQAYAVGR
jgi:gamma-glutamyltranspeptidase/glutathione hydrolase